MSNFKPLNQFCREDEFNPASDFSNPIHEKWIHKQIVVKTGDTEDDFVLDEKPVLIEKIDLHKRINEEAKTTDLKYLLTQLLRQNGEVTGLEPELNVRKGFYGDVTSIQNAIENKAPISSPESLKEDLPDELKALSVETLASMSDQDILGYIAKVRSEAAKMASQESEKEGE